MDVLTLASEVIRIASPKPGNSFSSTARVASGVTSRTEIPVPPVVTGHPYDYGVPGAKHSEFAPPMSHPPSGPPLVPNWARVWAGVHDAGPQLLAAVQQGPA